MYPSKFVSNLIDARAAVLSLFGSQPSAVGALIESARQVAEISDMGKASPLAKNARRNVALSIEGVFKVWTQSEKAIESLSTRKTFELGDEWLWDFIKGVYDLLDRIGDFQLSENDRNKARMALHESLVDVDGRLGRLSDMANMFTEQLGSRVVGRLPAERTLELEIPEDSTTDSLANVLQRLTAVTAALRIPPGKIVRIEVGSPISVLSDIDPGVLGVIIAGASAIMAALIAKTKTRDEVKRDKLEAEALEYKNKILQAELRKKLADEAAEANLGQEYSESAFLKTLEILLETGARFPRATKHFAELAEKTAPHLLREATERHLLTAGVGRDPATSDEGQSSAEPDALPDEE